MHSPCCTELVNACAALTCPSGGPRQSAQMDLCFGLFICHITKTTKPSPLEKPWQCLNGVHGDCGEGGGGGPLNPTCYHGDVRMSLSRVLQTHWEGGISIQRRVPANTLPSPSAPSTQPPSPLLGHSTTHVPALLESSLQQILPEHPGIVMFKMAETSLAEHEMAPVWTLVSPLLSEESSSFWQPSLQESTGLSLS